MIAGAFGPCLWCSKSATLDAEGLCSMCTNAPKRQWPFSASDVLPSDFSFDDCPVSETLWQAIETLVYCFERSDNPDALDEALIAESEAVDAPLVSYGTLRALTREWRRK